MNQKILKEKLNELFKKNGYEKIGLSWFSRGDATVVFIALQKSRYSEKFTLEIGLCIDMAREIKSLKYYSCGISFRLDDALNEDQIIFERGLNFEENNEEYFSAFIELMNKKGIEFINSLLAFKNVRKLFKGGFFSDKSIDNISLEILSKK